MSDPKQRFLWALQYGLEFNGMPFQAPQPVLEKWSEFLSRCGFVHVSQLPESVPGLRQEIHYQPPLRGSDGLVPGTGEFVPIEQPIRESFKSRVSDLTLEEKRVLLEEFRREGLL